MPTMPSGTAQAKSWYLNIMIDQYSKYPVVHVVDSTSWEDLQLALEETMVTGRKQMRALL